jgi:hypothetical protein
MAFFKLIVLLAIVTAGNAFSLGAGACFPGDANVRARHISNLGELPGRSIRTGSLADGGFEVLFDGSPLRTDSTTFFTFNQDFPIRVRGQESYRGILIRLGAEPGVNTTAALVEEDSTLLQDASVCSDPAQGLTHTSSVLKNNQGGTIRLNEKTDVSLDITIVVANKYVSLCYC